MGNRVEDVVCKDQNPPCRMILSLRCRVLARPHSYNGSGHPYLRLFIFDENGTLLKRDRNGRMADSWDYNFQYDSIDPDGHLAFCAGAMPPHVYADWLEERLSDVPAELLELLRERMGEGS